MVDNCYVLACKINCTTWGTPGAAKAPGYFFHLYLARSKVISSVFLSSHSDPVPPGDFVLVGPRR